MADVATAVLIYVLLAPVNRTISLAAAAFRLIQSAVLGANLLNHLMAIQLLEGDGLLGGYTTEQRNSLVLQSSSRPIGSATSSPSSSSPSTSCCSRGSSTGPSYLPRWIGCWLGAAAAGYTIDSIWFFLSPGYDGAFSPLVLAPALVAELLPDPLAPRPRDRHRSLGSHRPMNLSAGEGAEGRGRCGVEVTVRGNHRSGGSGGGFQAVEDHGEAELERVAEVVARLQDVRGGEAARFGKCSAIGRDEVVGEVGEVLPLEREAGLLDGEAVDEGVEQA